jgi:MATE family multidrug resistance protein
VGFSASRNLPNPRPPTYFTQRFWRLTALNILTNLTVPLTSLVDTAGTIILAADTILYGVQMLAAYFVDGAAFATESLAGIFQGANDRNALLRLRKSALHIGLLLALPFVPLMVIAPAQTYAVLTFHGATLETAIAHIAWLVPVLLLGSLAFIYDGYFLGLTRARSLRYCMLVSSILVLLPLALLALHTQNSHVLWLAMTLFMAARAASLWWSDRRLNSITGSLDP